MSNKIVKQHTLKNGLHIIGEINPANQSAGLGFFVNTGSRDEVGRESGVSHFLEHMLFKGTPNRSALQLTYDLGNIGAQANAYTSEENTVYYAGVVPEYFNQFHQILCDMLRPSLDLEEFTTEKKVILEEIALYLDRPFFYLMEQASADYYRGHPAGNSVLGSIQSITDVTRDEMQSYFDRRYSPANMVLVAAGNFNWDQLVENTEKLCSDWKNFDTGRQRPDFEFKKTQKVYRKDNLKVCHLLLATPGAAAQSPDRYALALLASVLGDSSGSRLYWELTDKGLVDSVGADSDERDSIGTFSVFASVEPEKLEQVKGIIYKILEDPFQCTARDLERAKTKLITRIVLSGELPMGRLMALGGNWLSRGEISDLQTTISRIKAVDLDTLKGLSKTYPLKDWSQFELLPS